MASLIDSIKTVVGDSNPFFKLAGLSFFIFVVDQLVSYNTVTPVFKNVLIAIAALVLFGFIVETIHNNINENNVIMPGLFNPLGLIVVAIRATLSLLPYIALVYYSLTWLNSFLTFLPWVNYIILGVVFVVLFSFFVMGLLLFCKNYNTLECLNVLTILKHSGDFIVYNFTLAISIIIFITVVFLPIGFFLKISFGYGFVFDYYVTFAIMFILISMAQYYSQLYSEYIALDNR